MRANVCGHPLGFVGLALVLLYPASPTAASSPRDSALLVLAGASLTDVLPRVASAWTERSGVAVRFSFDATSRLAPQTLTGAPADLFFSADLRWMDWVQERGGILTESRVDLLGNELVIVVPAAADTWVSGPEDLLDPALRAIALAGENVPAGRYARAALETAGVWEGVEDRVVRGGTVRGALEWVARGEVAAGVVYRTDVAPEERVSVAYTFAPGAHPPIRYPAAILVGASLPEQAADFLEFCRSPVATTIFAGAGFTPLVQRLPDPPETEATGSGLPDDLLPNPWWAIRLSFWVALVATLAGFAPAVALGWVLARRDFLGKSVVTTVVLVPLVLPPVVTGFILLSIFGTQSPVGGWLAGLGLPVPFTLLGATLAALAVGFPLYVISVRNAFQTVDPTYEAVSWTLGRRPWPTFLRVTFPLALPGMAAGAVLAFGRALGEFGATVVLAGNVEGSTRTIALAVFTLLESPGGRGAIWFLVAASVVLSLLALLGFEILSRHQRKQMGKWHGR